MADGGEGCAGRHDDIGCAGRGAYAGAAAAATRTFIVVGNDPVGVAVNSLTNTVYVANLGSGTVSAISEQTGLVTSTSLGSSFEPYQVAVNTQTGIVFVSDANHNLLAAVSGI